MQKNPVKPKRHLRKRLRENIPLTLLALPAIVYVFIFNYLPMFGVVVAFKDFKYTKGILGSAWAGLKNFKYFFSSNDVFTVIGNTVGYSLVFLLLDVIVSVMIAVFLYEITSKIRLKIYQTSILLPSFISWVLVTYIVFVLLSHEYGLVNQLLEALGFSAVKWYDTPSYWRFIMPMVYLWKIAGNSCIIYYAALMGVDASLYEAAEIDGAGRWKKLIHITLPSIMPVVCIMLILGIGGAMNGNFGLFYQVPRQSPALYPTTDIINTYVYRGLQNGSIGVSAAVGLFQSFVGMILLLVTNAVVRKINPENAMF